MELCPLTIAAWMRHGFAALHTLRPDPAKAKARAWKILQTLVTQYGDAFVARAIADSRAWCLSHPTKVRHRVNHDDAVRRWCKTAAEDLAAKQPGARPQAAGADVDRRALDRYTCGKCGRTGRTDYLTYAKHWDACHGVSKGAPHA